MAHTKTDKPRRNKLKLFLIILAVLVVTELLAATWLYFSVSHFKSFWVERAKQPGEITYLALGDSAAQGIGATSPMRGYVGLIANQLAAKTGKKVRIVNLSVTGATVRDCLQTQIPNIKDIKADYVTVEIGANDVKAMNADGFTKDIAELLPQLPKNAFVSNMPLFNSRPSSTKPAKNYSVIIQEAVQKDGRLHFVDLQKQTSEHQSIFGFAPDLFHPNNLSYKNWYQAFWDQIGPTL